MYGTQNDGVVVWGKNYRKDILKVSTVIPNTFSSYKDSDNREKLRQ